MKIIVASDSFKGSLSSQEVASAVAHGIALCAPDAKVIKFTVADGGEGTTDAIMHALPGGRYKDCVVKDPLGRSIQARYGIIKTPKGETAIIDVATASGLTHLTPLERNPMKASSYGTGQLIADALTCGCRNFIIGLGGSATVDGGKGMLSALGYRFIDSYGHTLPPGGASLSQLHSISNSTVSTALKESHFTAICDVDNPLCGPKGAANIFAPQKGATPNQISQLARGLQTLSNVIYRLKKFDVASLPSAGAAGGIAATLAAFLHCEIKSGADAVLDITNFDDALRNADLVITGEGRIDEQTLHGKLPYKVMLRARNAGVPTVALAGEVRNFDALLSAGFKSVYCIAQSHLSTEDNMLPSNAMRNISATVTKLFQEVL